MYNSSFMIPAVLFLPVFLLLRFVYPLSGQKIEDLPLEKEKVLGAAKETPLSYKSFPPRGKVASADLPRGGCRMRENKIPLLSRNHKMQWTDTHFRIRPLLFRFFFGPVQLMN